MTEYVRVWPALALVKRKREIRLSSYRDTSILVSHSIRLYIFYTFIRTYVYIYLFIYLIFLFLSRGGEMRNASRACRRSASANSGNKDRQPSTVVPHVHVSKAPDGGTRGEKPRESFTLKNHGRFDHVSRQLGDAMDRLLIQTVTSFCATDVTSRASRRTARSCLRSASDGNARRSARCRSAPPL